MSRPYVVLSGLAWGVLVTTFQSLAQPPLDLSLSDYLAFYSRILLHYSAGGILLALATSRISELDERFPKLIAIMPAIAAAAATALLIDWLSVTLFPFWRDDPMAAMWQLSALGTHMAWVFSVYGGLYVLTYFLLQKGAQARERLRVAELARIGAEARIDRAVTATLPAVAPDLLLRALSELALRYGKDPAGADRLLDKLVRLLRLASTTDARGLHVEAHDGRDAGLAAEEGNLRAELGLSANFSRLEAP